MAAEVSSDRPRLVVHVVPIVAKPFTKVNVLEPDRVEPFVESAHLLPNFTTKHQKRAGGLFHFGWLVIVESMATVMPIDGVGWPEAIDEQYFEGQGERGGKVANGKAGLRGVAGVH